MSYFRGMLQNKTLILDGGMGSMLQARGLPAGESPENFVWQHPEILQSIHSDYVEAGADIILTCTFGGSGLKLPRNLRVQEFNKRMAQVAKDVAERSRRDIFVGGDIGPCGLFVKPLGELEPLVLWNIYREQVRGLVAGGVDFLMVETQLDLAEVRLIVSAIREECDLPILASMTFEGETSLTGTSPEIFAQTMYNLQVDAVGLNCGAGPTDMAPLVQRFLAATHLPIVVEPNAGLPELEGSETVFKLPPEPFAQQVAAFVEQGVRLVGGCCGTTPAHIKALREAVNSLPAWILPRSKSELVHLTSRQELVSLGTDQPLVIIGERINPTGKKALAQALAAQDYNLALEMAKEQVSMGAQVLDVNVGAPLLDETIALPEITQLLASYITAPLALDSSNSQAITAALPYYPGSALVNSISGEAGRMEYLGPWCKQWGAPFVLLPLQGNVLPESAQERIAILEKLLRQAEDLKIPRHLIVVDILALSTASNPLAGKEALATLTWCKRHGLPTTMGLSNISFGLPARELINTTFLSLAMGYGLSSCIANPQSSRLHEVKASCEVLLQRDPDAGRFINNYAKWTPSNQTLNVTEASAAPLTLKQAVIDGSRQAIVPLLEAALAEGRDAFNLVNEDLIPGITRVGELYEQRQYFLPQLLRSAETMQLAFKYLKPILTANKQALELPTVILATVEGDIHDIGKNIVGLMLQNHGFNIVDLGKDISAKTIVDAAKLHKAKLIGLSALMTTTMIRMQDTVDLLKTENLSIPVMVGGAVLTPDYAERIGASYSKDAISAVRLAKELVV